MASPTLSPLTDRLRHLSHTTTTEEALIKSESDVFIDPFAPKYICAECAQSFSDPQGLGSHYRFRHTISATEDSIACPRSGCESRFRSQDALTHHQRSIHALRCQYPTCSRIFGNEALLYQHEVSHSMHDWDFVARTCPAPGCGISFPNQASLFQHYDGRHPQSIKLQNGGNRFKCPFCTKKYKQEKFMGVHQRKEHMGKEVWISEEGQDRLIMESWENVAQGKEEDAERMFEIIGEYEMDVDVPAVGVSDITAGSLENNNEDAEVKMEAEEDGDHTIKVENGRVYIDDIPRPETINSPSPPQRTTPVPDGTPPARTEHMSIGYVLASSPSPHSGRHSVPSSPLSSSSSPTSATSPTSSSDSDDPEDLALEPHERPKKRSNRTRDTTDRFASDALGQRLLHHILQLLGLSPWLSTSEVLDLWEDFLTPPQRIIILSQLQDLNANVGDELDDGVILSALHGTVLVAVIHAWARFKLLTFHLPPNTHTHAKAYKSAKATVWGILSWCIEVESFVKEAHHNLLSNKITIALPNRLRHYAPDDDAGDVEPTTQFGVLLEAMERRVRCRVCHGEWTRFTNELVLREMGPYMEDLRGEAWALRRVGLREEGRWRAMGLA